MGFPTAVDVVVNLDDLRSLFGLNATLVGDVVVDLLMSYTAAREAEVSEHPVEDGFDIANARVIKPQSIFLECILTDPQFGAANIATNLLSGTASNLTTSWRDKRDRLDQLFLTQDYITVTTPEREYKNMTIINIVPDRRSSTANAYFCTIEVREIRKVSSDLSTVDPALIPKEVEKKATDEQKTVAKKRKPAKATRGNKATKTATEKDQSILNALIFD